MPLFHRRRLLFASVCALAIAATAYPLAVTAAPYPAGASGYDVSWPQCGGPLPGRGELAVVGVNDGHPYSVNPCLAAEWGWAAPSQSASLYINLDRSAGDVAAHGGSAYGDGWAAAAFSASVAGAQGAHPVMWWLDVETTGDWSCGAVCNTAADADVVRGAIDFFRQHGAPVGIYSNPVQWSIIAGGYAPGVPVWTTDYDDPHPWTHCGAGDSFAGGPVALVQLFPAAFDSDFICATPAGVLATSATRPEVVGVRGADGGLWIETGGGAFGFSQWGGDLIADPALAWVPRVDGGAVLLAVANGTDHSLWVRSSIYGWAPLSPFSSCTDNPAIAVTGPVGALVLTVACRGFDGALWAGQAPITADARPSITGFSLLGGALSGGPAVGEVGGEVMFAAAGNGGLAYFRTLTRAWTPTTLTCLGHPALASGAGVAYLACRGTDGGLWYASNTGGGWMNGVPAGGQILGGPGMAATPKGDVYAFVEGVDHAVYDRRLALDPSIGAFRWDGGSVLGFEGAGAA